MKDERDIKQGTKYVRFDATQRVDPTGSAAIQLNWHATTVFNIRMPIGYVIDSKNLITSALDSK
jgi:hypothetical protein